MGVRGWCAVALLVAAGCGGDGPPTPEGCEPGAFVGTWETARLGATGEVLGLEPVDLRGTRFTALVREGATTREIEGVSELGAFRNDDVPDARPIMIRTDAYGLPVYLVTDACRWDSRRGDFAIEVAYASGDDTQVLFELDGLVPWQAGHELYAWLPRLTDLFTLTDYGLAAGDTRAVGSHQDGEVWPLVDASDAEEVIAYQSARTTLTGASVALAYDGLGTIATLVAAAEVAPFTIVEGAETTVSATLSPLAANRTLSLAVDGDAFRSLADALPGVSDVNIHSYVGASYWGCSADFPDLVAIGVPASGWTDVVAHPYADPMPDTLPRVACSDVSFRVGEQGDAFVGTLRGVLTQNRPLAELEGGTLAPAVSFPRSVAVANQNVFGPMAPVGGAPSITWDPPLLGEPISYDLLLNRLVPPEGALNRFDPAALFIIDVGTEVTLPEGLLEPGESYQISLNAYLAEGSARLTSEVPFTP